MKSFSKMFVVIAIIAIFGIMFFSCIDKPQDQSARGFSEIKEDRTVHPGFNFDPESMKYTARPSSTSIDFSFSNDFITAETTSDGRLNFNLKTPVGEDLMNREEFLAFWKYGSNISVAPGSANKFAVIPFLESDGVTLRRGESLSMTGRASQGYKQTYNYMYYIYVEAEQVVIKADIHTSIPVLEPGPTIYTRTVREYTISLRKGWNMVTFANSSDINGLITHIDTTTKLKVENPDKYRWTVDLIPYYWIY